MTMILSSADILTILGGSEIIRLSARIKIVDEKPVLSGDEYLYICIGRFPNIDEFQATWTIWVEGDGEETLVVEEIKRLLPGVKVNSGLITELTITDFLSKNTQRTPGTPKQVQASAGTKELEERFQELSEDIDDRMLLISSGRDGQAGVDGKDGVNGRDGKDFVATDVELFDLKDTGPSVVGLKKGQVLTWDGAHWTNLYVPTVSGTGGGGGGSFPEAPIDGKQYARKDAGWDKIVTAEGPEGPAGPGVAPGGDTGQVLSKADGSDYSTEWVTPSAGIEEAPNDGLYYVRHNGTWVRLAEALDVLQSDTIDGGIITD